MYRISIVDIRYDERYAGGSFRGNGVCMYRMCLYGIPVCVFSVGSSILVLGLRGYIQCVSTDRGSYSYAIFEGNKIQLNILNRPYKVEPKPKELKSKYDNH